MARLFTLSESKYYLMALDAGTGSIRAVIFDLEGNQIAVGQAEWRHLAVPDVPQDPEVNSRFYIYEAYKDEDAVAFHKTTPHYKTCVAKLESLMTGPRKKRLFNGLMP